MLYKQPIEWRKHQLLTHEGIMTANHQEAIPTTGYIRRCNLAKLLDTSVSTIDRWVRIGKLPKPTKLGEKNTVFNAVEINHWLNERRNNTKQ
jgi:prophage regulatory protein